MIGDNRVRDWQMIGVVVTEQCLARDNNTVSSLSVGLAVASSLRHQCIEHACRMKQASKRARTRNHLEMSWNTD